MKKDELTHQIIGAAMEVHRVLGPGFLESVYEKSLAVELTSKGIEAQCQISLKVEYKNHPVGDFVVDMFIPDEIVVELKAVSRLQEIHEVQLVNYLTALGKDTGLLINFGAKSLEFKRKFRNPKKDIPNV
jgi:GxxExxY protein